MKEKRSFLATFFVELIKRNGNVLTMYETDTIYLGPLED